MYVVSLIQNKFNRTGIHQNDENPTIQHPTSIPATLITPILHFSVGVAGLLLIILQSWPLVLNFELVMFRAHSAFKSNIRIALISMVAQPATLKLETFHSNSD